MTVGITGWRGFIGSHLKDKLGNPIIFQGDMRNLDSVKSFVGRCDRIYHIAGKNRDMEGNIIANNLLSTGNLILACKIEKVEPEIIFASSNQIIRNPYSEFGFTKLIEERIVTQAKNWSIFRIPNVYGEGCKPLYNSVVATFAYQIASGKEVILRNQDIAIEFIYIDDLVEYLLHPKLGSYMCPKGEMMTVGQIYEYMTAKLGEHEKLKNCLDYEKNRLKEKINELSINQR